MQRTLACGLMVLIPPLASGCIFRTTAQQQKLADSDPQLWGTVSSEREGDHRLVIVLYRYDENGEAHIFDHVTRARPGEGRHVPGARAHYRST